MQINRPEGRIARRSYSALLKFEMLQGRLGFRDKTEPEEESEARQMKEALGIPLKEKFRSP